MQRHWRSYRPVGNYCFSTFSPIVTIRNTGLETMTSVDIQYSIDGASPLTYFWTGSLETYETEDVTLPSISLGDGTQHRSYRGRSKRTT